MQDKQLTRLKVNKKIDAELRIVKLRPSYLGLYAVFFVFGLIVVFANFSFKILVVVLIYWGLLYLLAQFLDTISFLSNYKKSNIPKNIINDLF